MVLSKIELIDLGQPADVGEKQKTKKVNKTYEHIANNVKCII